MHDVQRDGASLKVIGNMVDVGRVIQQGTIVSAALSPRERETTLHVLHSQGYC